MQTSSKKQPGSEGMGHISFSIFLLIEHFKANRNSIKIIRNFANKEKTSFPFQKSENKFEFFCDQMTSLR